jgi:hypothetical protein
MLCPKNIQNLFIKLVIAGDEYFLSRISSEDKGTRPRDNIVTHKLKLADVVLLGFWYIFTMQ